MHFAVINEVTKIVENVVVPPKDAGSIWFCPAGYDAIETEVGAIGDTYNSETGEFIKPQTEEPQPQDEIVE